MLDGDEDFPMSPADTSHKRSGCGQPPRQNVFERILTSELELVSAAIALGAGDIQPWSEREIELLRRHRVVAPSDCTLSVLRSLIREGADPLGDLFCGIRSPDRRRDSGATYTPESIVRAMVGWAAEQRTAQRIIDPGAGSARFLLHAGRAFPEALLVGVETDPIAALMARANLAVCGWAKRARVVLQDYRDFDEPFEGRTLYIGNPPYVRHHGISGKWKEWLSKEAGRVGYRASQLAGLHVHFFVATARRAAAGDFGTFVTASEWLDVNYGSLVRSLFVRDLGGRGITIIDPKAHPFPDAATTAAITTFEVASKPVSVFFRRIDKLSDLDRLEKGHKIDRTVLESQSRWSHLLHSADGPPKGYVELGELCRVHRGQVTGANRVWIAGSHSNGLPECVLYPSVTKAKEVIAAHGILRDAGKLRCVIDIPCDLDELDPDERRAVERFLRIARMKGANRGYVASHRKAWWSVGLHQPAPIIATYMARRSPAFVLNEAKVRHINVAHGLYPREPMSVKARTSLVHFLQANVSQRAGRTYAGGLTKFEPREMERLFVPPPVMLAAGAFE